MYLLKQLNQPIYDSVPICEPKPLPLPERPALISVCATDTGAWFRRKWRGLAFLGCGVFWHRRHGFVVSVFGHALNVTTGEVYSSYLRRKKCR
jgi:hypothetical protein